MCVYETMRKGLFRHEHNWTKPATPLFVVYGFSIQKQTETIQSIKVENERLQRADKSQNT